MRFSFLSLLLCLSSYAAALPDFQQAPPKGPPPMERYIARTSQALQGLDHALKTVPPGGTPQDAQRITESLIKMQRVIIEDLENGAREVRAFNAAPLGVIPGIRNSLPPLGTQMQAVMNRWIAQKIMVNAAGRIPTMIRELEAFSSAWIRFADACASKLGSGSSTWIRAFSDQGRYSVEAAINAYKR
jgi:hypothetical protein